MALEGFTQPLFLQPASQLVVLGQDIAQEVVLLVPGIFAIGQLVKKHGCAILLEFMG